MAEKLPLPEDDDIEDLWDELLTCIGRGSVIPIVGEQLLQVEAEGRLVPLYQYLAEKLIERLRLPPPEDGKVADLNSVVCEYVARRGRREDVYRRVRTILNDAKFQPPPALRKLARIRGFKLFISLTFDSLLLDALNEERYPGRDQGALQLAYETKRLVDLPRDFGAGDRATVYHLLGQVSPLPEYVITEEDTLEFIYALQSETRRPPILFDQLRLQNLLFIGCNFSDWLARFMIRTTKSRQLSLQRGEIEVLVHPAIHSDPNLVLFLRHFSYATRLMPQSASDFVDELWTRWSASHPDGPPPPVTSGRAEPVSVAPGSDVVFLSYASQDREAADTLREGLQSRGIKVWFDREALAGGDKFAPKIEHAIRNCGLFVPIITDNTQARPEGFFRREWRWAVERSADIADDTAFIVPVALSDIDAGTARVPDKFRDLHWTRLPEHGAATPSFVSLVTDLLDRKDGR